MSTTSRTPRTLVGFDPAPPLRRRPGGLILGVLTVMATGAVIGIFAADDSLLVGLFALLLMLSMVLLRIPIALTLIVPALLGMWSIGGMRLLRSMLSTAPFTEIASWSLSVIPMFVFMGVVLASTGLAESMYRVARQWLWWLPGGLAVGTNFAGAGLAAVTGSTMGTIYTLARVGVPEMLKAGYDRRLAIVSIMAAGLPGQLIPPSIMLIVYAGIVQSPVGSQLMAGVVPGVLVAGVFAAVLMTIGYLTRGSLVHHSSEPRAGFGMMMRSLGQIWPIPVIMVIIIGGMFTGFFTATEAGAAAAVVTVVLGAAKFAKARNWRPLGDAILETLGSTGMIFLLILGASYFSNLLSLTGISAAFADLIDDAGFTRLTFLLVMFVVYLILGMFMDTLSMILLTVPVLLPTFASLDISPIWFGVFVVLMAEVGLYTPPVGMLSFLIHGLLQNPQVNLGRRITLGDVFVAAFWLLPGVLVVVALLIFFPEIALWLPSLSAE